MKDKDGMKRAACPVAGFEAVEIVFPGVWLVRHNEAFWAAYREAGETISHNTALLHGCIAVCDEIKGLPTDKPVGEWPLAVFIWFIDTVFHQGLEKALNPPKN